MGLSIGRGDGPAQAVANHENLDIRVAASYYIDVSVQVLHILAEALDVAPSALGIAMSAVVQSADEKPCGDELIHEVQVTPAVLCQAVHQQQ